MKNTKKLLKHIIKKRLESLYWGVNEGKLFTYINNNKIKDLQLDDDFKYLITRDNQ